MKRIHTIALALVATLMIAACGTTKKSPYKEIKESLTMAQVSRVGDSIRVVFPELTMFDFGKDELKADIRPAMASFTSVMKKYNQYNFQINGYTDNVGTDDVNMDLSRRRAENVRRDLEGRGIAASRMTIDGRGPARPIASNATDYGRSLNRRVEFMIFMMK